MRLPLLHNDPFDRLIIAQAATESLPLITHDAMISQYQVDLIW
jgi:PIN domain nuclease of toxin-antitoxin system